MDIMIFFIKINNRSLFTTSDYCKYCHCIIFKLIEIICNLVVAWVVGAVQTKYIRLALEPSSSRISLAASWDFFSFSVR